MHEFDDGAELPKVNVLLGLQGMPHEKLANTAKSLQLANSQAKAITMVAADNPGFEETLQGHQNGAFPFMLDDNELRQHLESDRHLVVPVQADMKATFPIHETSDPIVVELHDITLRIRILGVWPLRIPAEAGFLRIAQSPAIVTPRRAVEET